MKGKNSCPDIIPDNMPTGCAPDNRRPEKICGTCRHFNPEFPVNGNPAPVCLAIKQMKGETEYTNPVERNRIFVAQMESTKAYINRGKRPRKTYRGFCCL